MSLKQEASPDLESENSKSDSDNLKNKNKTKQVSNFHHHTKTYYPKTAAGKYSGLYSIYKHSSETKVTPGWLNSQIISSPEIFHAVPGRQKAASYGEKLKLPVKYPDGWVSSSTKLLGVCTDVWADS